MGGAYPYGPLWGVPLHPPGELWFSKFSKVTAKRKVMEKLKGLRKKVIESQGN